MSVGNRAKKRSQQDGTAARSETRRDAAGKAGGKDPARGEHKEREIRVLQLAKYYAPFEGGTEQVTRDIANALKTCGIRQKVLCYNSDASDGTRTTRRGETVREMVDGVEVIRCGVLFKALSQSVSLTYPRELKKIMRAFRPTVVILHYPNPYATHFLLKYKDMPFRLYVWWHLDITRQRRVKKLFDHQNRALIDRADGMIATSPNYLCGSPWLTRAEGKCSVIPNCINASRLAIGAGEKREAAAIRKKYEGKVLCFFIGRHVPYKGLTYLIEASRLLGEDSPLRFFIAGSGELTQKLKAQAAGDKKIRFPGRISDAELRAYLSACDIFCFPSIAKNEAFGLALAEAMYFGKPAVTFTIPGSGVNYVNLNGVTGIEVPNKDAAAYAAALRKLGADPTLRRQYGAAARQRVLENFTYEKFREHVLRLILG